MPEYLAPGVYVEELTPAGPIQGVETSTTAFVGLARGDRRPPHTLRITSATELEAAYGDLTDAPMGRAVRDYFANGGAVALVIRAKSLDIALERLAAADAFQLLVVARRLGEGHWDEVHALGERRRAFLIADAGDDGSMPHGLGRNAAAYHPRLLDADGATRTVTGAVAGVIARNDRTRGVWKAPAGSATALTAGSTLARNLTSSEMETLNTSHVNALRALPEGVVIWGARTASTDPEWKYVNVRRLILFLEESIERGLQWAAFEPNDLPLWQRARALVEGFLVGLWRQGALMGAKAQEAFFVRCDETTMTQTDIAAGRLVVLIGVAPVRPAEFVILRITQQTEV